MGKKYLNTKKDTLEASVLDVWQLAAEEMDPVNPKAAKKKFKDRKDKDIDNDGDVDSSDEYLHKRRKAIGKAMKSEGLEDSPNAANSQHLCAKNVVHEEWGEGQPVHGMHAMPDVDGNIAWYDVMFEHGIEKGVTINELKVTAAEMHNDHGGKKKKNEGITILPLNKKVVKKPKPKPETKKETVYFAPPDKKVVKKPKPKPKKEGIRIVPLIKPDVKKPKPKPKKEGAMKRGKDLDTFKPKPPTNEEVELEAFVSELLEAYVYGEIEIDALFESLTEQSPRTMALKTLARLARRGIEGIRTKKQKKTAREISRGKGGRSGQMQNLRKRKMQPLDPRQPKMGVKAPPAVPAGGGFKVGKGKRTKRSEPFGARIVGEEANINFELDKLTGLLEELRNQYSFEQQKEFKVQSMRDALQKVWEDA